jgi:surfactin synthase thioesterase subunit
MPARNIVFSHGRDGEPRGAKIMAMADVAKRHGLTVESVDYRAIPDPAARVQRLAEVCGGLSGPFVFVGSSLGAHVCTTVAARFPTRGLFLLAPAFFMPGYERHTPAPPACPVAIVHGWNDDIVPVENSIRFARQHKAILHVLDGDHRLTAHIPELCELLDMFLRKLPSAAT